MKEKICGVYAIRNKINNKVYIGSSIDILSRWKSHEKELNKGRHHSEHLQYAWDKYGKDNFEFMILEECSEENVREREQYYIDYYTSYDGEYGYNISETANPLISEIVRQRNKIATSLALRGEGTHFNVYPETKALEVIELLKTGKYAHTQISKMCSVPKGFVDNIVSHREWSYLTDGIEFPPPLMSGRENVKLKEEDIPIIIDMINAKFTNGEIAERFDVVPKTISDIRNHKTWKNYTDGMIFCKSPRSSKPTVLQQKIIDTYKLDTARSGVDIAKIVGASPSMVSTTLIKYNK